MYSMRTRAREQHASHVHLARTALRKPKRKPEYKKVSVRGHGGHAIFSGPHSRYFAYNFLALGDAQMMLNSRG